jgi:hypothetical protein
MNTTQYLRKCRLLVGDDDDALDLSDFRIRFQVRRGDWQTPNSADIRIYNLSAATSNRIKGEFTRVRLEAGYEGNYGLIFDGTITQVRRGRESQTDTYVDITAADGDAAYNFAVISVTLAAGSTPMDQLRAIVASMESRGISLGDIPELPDYRLPRAKVMFGMARDAMTNLAVTLGCSWSIQDGRLTLVPDNGYLLGEAVVLRYDTGMIGLPRQTINGIEVKALINPMIKIGKRIHIDNASIQEYRYSPGMKQLAKNMQIKEQIDTSSDGFYRVLQVNYSGDTRGEEWYSEIFCVAVDATVSYGGAITMGIPGAIGQAGPVKPYQ